MINGELPEITDEPDLLKLVKETINRCMRANSHLFINEWDDGEMVLDGEYYESDQEIVAKAVLDALKAAGVKL